MASHLGWIAFTAGLSLVMGCSDADEPGSLPVDAGMEGGEASAQGNDAAEELKPASCGGHQEAACKADATCHWLVASCPDEFIAAACLGAGVSPQPPPCAPQPCRTYLTEQDCEAQSACNWWPEACPGKTYTDRCRNIGSGNPDDC